MNVISIGRREVTVAGDGNCFYSAVARSLHGKHDRNHLTVRSICSRIIQNYPNVLQPLLFTYKTVHELLKHSRKDGTWAKTADIFSCATAIQRILSLCIQCHTEMVKV